LHSSQNVIKSDLNEDDEVGGTVSTRGRKILVGKPERTKPRVCERNRE